MATVNQACNLMKKWLKMPCTESNGKADRYIIAPWNRATGCHATASKNPWCAITVSSCLKQIKAAGFSMSSTCKNQKAYFKKHKRFFKPGTKPRRGDVLFITGHEGVITCVRTNGTGAYISGNSSNAVRLGSFNWKTGKCGSRKIQGYGRPIYK